MPFLLQRPIRLLQAAWFRSTGRIGYHLGARAAARRHFERVLELRGDDFVSYIYLGRLAYDDGDIAGWRRECLHARRVAPLRYERLQRRFEPRGPFELYEPPVEPSAGAAGWRGLGAVGERATWYGPAGSDPVDQLPPLATASLVGHAWDLDPTPVPRVRPPLGAGDDFVDDAERDSFAGLPPIAADDVAVVDLDALARRLTDPGDDDAA